jgi:hypothetical protein
MILAKWDWRRVEKAREKETTNVSVRSDENQEINLGST